jgi:heme/copper-type cytochrome/quinol oxidase subunit 4
MTDDSQRDGTEAGTAAMLYAGAITGVLLRGAVWVFSAFTAGPVLGFLDTAAVAWSAERDILFLQAVLTVVAVVAAVLCGVGLQTDPARYRRPVRLLAAVFIADVLLYLAPIVTVATLPVPVSDTEWTLFGVAVVGNLALAGLCLLIIHRARRLRPAAVPAATLIEV